MHLLVSSCVAIFEKCSLYLVDLYMSASILRLKIGKVGLAPTTQQHSNYVRVMCALMAAKMNVRSCFVSRLAYVAGYKIGDW